jgi:hypothetical protein
MKETHEPLRLFSFSHLLLATELPALTGDKYAHALPFPWVLTADYDAADVVLWDGVITPRNRGAVVRLLADARGPKVLLLVGESATLLRDNPVAELVDPAGLNAVELPNWNLLPEDLLAALVECRKRVTRV